MKIAGFDLTKKRNVIIPIILGEDEVIFQAQIVEDYDEFDKLCPEPTPPTKMNRGDTVATPYFEDPEYQKALNTHGEKRVAYMFIKSLEATKDLKWDKVSLADPETWTLYQDELREGGFNDMHIGQILKGVMEANGLSQDRIEEAKNRFLAMQQEVPQV